MTLPNIPEYPRSCTHVGITVTDLERAVEWYQIVLGFYPIAGPFDLIGDNSHFGHIAIDLFGSSFGRGRLIMMGMGNQVGLEIFEFHQPKSDPWRNPLEIYPHSL